MRTTRITWFIIMAAAGALAAAITLALTSCTNAAPGAPPPVDANECDLVSCAAGMALECCPAVVPQPKRKLVVGAVQADSPPAGPSGGPTFTGTSWRWGTVGWIMYFPAPVPVGCILHTASLRLQKVSDATTRFTLELQEIVDGIGGLIVRVQNEANAPGPITMTIAPDHLFEPMLDHTLLVARTGGNPDDRVFFVEIVYSCPSGGA